MTRPSVPYRLPASVTIKFLSISTAVTAVFLGPLAVLVLARESQLGIAQKLGGTVLPLASGEYLYALALALGIAALSPGMNSLVKSWSIGRVVRQYADLARVPGMVGKPGAFFRSYRALIDAHFDLFSSLLRLPLVLFFGLLLGAPVLISGLVSILLLTGIIWWKRMKEAEKAFNRGKATQDRKDERREPPTLVEFLRWSSYRRNLGISQLSLLGVPVIVAPALSIFLGQVDSIEGLLVTAGLLVTFFVASHEVLVGVAGYRFLALKVRERAEKLRGFEET